MLSEVVMLCGGVTESVLLFHCRGSFDLLSDMK